MHLCWAVHIGSGETLALDIEISSSYQCLEQDKIWHVLGPLPTYHT